VPIVRGFSAFVPVRLRNRRKTNATGVGNESEVPVSLSPYVCRRYRADTTHAMAPTGPAEGISLASALPPAGKTALLVPLNPTNGTREK